MRAGKNGTIFMRMITTLSIILLFNFPAISQERFRSVIVGGSIVLMAAKNGSEYIMIESGCLRSSNAHVGVIFKNGTQFGSYICRGSKQISGKYSSSLLVDNGIYYFKSESKIDVNQNQQIPYAIVRNFDLQLAIQGRNCSIIKYEDQQIITIQGQTPIQTPGILGYSSNRSCKIG
jgi:hypothetical protein